MSAGQCLGFSIHQFDKTLAVSSAVRHDFFIFASGLFMALAGKAELPQPAAGFRQTWHGFLPRLSTRCLLVY
jgi:hypothetical protein